MEKACLSFHHSFPKPKKKRKRNKLVKSLRRSRPWEIYLDSSKIPTDKQTNQPQFLLQHSTRLLTTKFSKRRRRRRRRRRRKLHNNNENITLHSTKTKASKAQLRSKLLISKLYCHFSWQKQHPTVFFPSLPTKLFIPEKQASSSYLLKTNKQTNKQTNQNENNKNTNFFTSNPQQNQPHLSLYLYLSLSLSLSHTHTHTKPSHWVGVVDLLTNKFATLVANLQWTLVCRSNQTFLFLLQQQQQQQQKTSPKM